jgi:hypothetical protein
MKTILLIAGLTVAGCFSGAAAPLTESTFTEIINQVNTLAADGSATAAQVNELLKAPGRVRTGPLSRAELTAPDKTITRVGANTVFSYADRGRAVNLEQGNVLFHAPKGLGGGTIQSGGASAAVLGTTLIVSASTGGGFKVILLEGKGRVTLPGGQAVTLRAGQEVFVLPGGRELSPVFNLNLRKLVGGSLLVKGFSHDLASLPLITLAIQQQDSELKSGGASDTGWPPEFFLPPPPPGSGLDVIDPATYQTAAHPPLSAAQLQSVFGPPSDGKPPAGQNPVGPGGRGVIIIPVSAQ